MAHAVIRTGGKQYRVAKDDTILVERIAAAIPAADAAIEELDFATAIGEIRSVVELVNQYVTEVEPWVLAKDDALAERLDTVLYTMCEALRAIAVAYEVHVALLKGIGLHVHKKDHVAHLLPAAAAGLRGGRPAAGQDL